MDADNEGTMDGNNSSISVPDIGVGHDEPWPWTRWESAGLEIATVHPLQAQGQACNSGLESEEIGFDRENVRNCENSFHPAMHSSSPFELQSVGELSSRHSPVTAHEKLWTPL